ncbi:MAG TPA: methyltransferase domain-containing protein [Dongiaceae bacterium]|nr:methyltransferase domain-containing protein [Dongiaceae bacterium]
MQASDSPEYGDAMVAALELIWGEGFLSPGGPAEVEVALAGRDLRGARVLDIGCGIGGIDLLLAQRFGAGHVLGIDVEADNIELARRRAAEKGLADRVSYRLVEPGPLPFEEARFDLVFSKDAIIHIPDKEALFADIFRILVPGGRFIASDWLRADDGPPSPAMERYIESEGLSFAMASPARYRRAMAAAGFRDIEIRDRNAWYAARAREELAALAGPLRPRLVKLVGEGEADRQTRVWENMLVVLDKGELRPTHLHGLKPKS